MKPVAVAVMARAPGLGPVKSRLHGSLTPERATDLYRCFLLDRLDGLAGVDGVARVIAFTPPEGGPLLQAFAPPGFSLIAQRGDDLGARLGNLLSDLLCQGYQGAIAIDSDSPTLPMGYVLDAAKQLETQTADVVLGPCEDGGYYLIGLSRPCAAVFDDIPWSTDRVLSLTLDKARQQGLRTHLLPAWFDVDTEPDLHRLRAEMLATGRGPHRTFEFVRELFGDDG